MADGLILVCWLTVNVLLGTAAFAVSRRFGRETGPWTIAASVTLWWATIVAVTTVLGLVGLLVAEALLATVGALAALALTLQRRELGRCLRGRNNLPAAEVDSDTITPLPFLFWGVFSLCWLSHALLNGVLPFPIDYDSLMYHMPLVVGWLQARSLYAPDCLHWSNPGTNEIVGLWLVGPFSGDFFMGLSNLPATILLAASCVAVCSSLGLSNLCAHLTSVAVVATFTVQKQLTDSRNDVAVAALFLATLLYGLRYIQRGNRFDLALGAVTLGLLAGVKYYALGYALAVWLALVLIAGLACGVCRAGRVGAVLLCGAVASGGYWYARNLWFGGSPFYPLALPGGKDTLAEIYPDIWSTTFLGNGSPELLRLGLDAVWRMAGPCYYVATLGLPLTFLWLTVSGIIRFSRATSRRQGSIRLGLAFLLAGCGAVTLVTPMAVEDVPGTLNQVRGGYTLVRYGLSFLSLAVLCLAVVLHDFIRAATAGLCAVPGRARDVFPHLSLLAGLASRVLAPLVHVAGCLAFLAGAAVQLFRLSSESQWRFEYDVGDVLLAGCTFSSGIAVLCLLCALSRRLRLVIFCSLPLALLAGAAWGTTLISSRWHGGFAEHYDRSFSSTIFTRLESSARPGVRICVLDFRPYPFFGSRRQFKVYQPILLPPRPSFFEHLRAHQVELLAVLTDLDPFPQDLNRYRWAFCWASEAPRQFSLLEEGPALSLFEVSPPARNK